MSLLKLSLISGHYFYGESKTKITTYALKHYLTATTLLGEGLLDNWGALYSGKKRDRRYANGRDLVQWLWQNKDHHLEEIPVEKVMQRAIEWGRLPDSVKYKDLSYPRSNVRNAPPLANEKRGSISKKKRYEIAVQELRPDLEWVGDPQDEGALTTEGTTAVDKMILDNVAKYCDAFLPNHWVVDIETADNLVDGRKRLDPFVLCWRRGRSSRRIASNFQEYKQWLASPGKLGAVAMYEAHLVEGKAQPTFAEYTKRFHFKKFATIYDVDRGRLVDRDVESFDTVENNCLSRFLQLLDPDDQHYMYCHNLGFEFKYFISHFASVSAIKVRAQVKCATGWVSREKKMAKVYLRCTCLATGGAALRKFPKMFKLKDFKEVMAYNLYNRENVCGPRYVPILDALKALEKPKSLAVINALRCPALRRELMLARAKWKEDCVQMVKNIDKWNLRDPTRSAYFDHLEYAIKYCEIDVDLTYDGYLIAYRNLVIKLC